jgi:hypothetical protein
MALYVRHSIKFHLMVEDAFAHRKHEPLQAFYLPTPPSSPYLHIFIRFVYLLCHIETVLHIAEVTL